MDLCCVGSWSSNFLSFGPPHSRRAALTTQPTFLAHNLSLSTKLFQASMCPWCRPRKRQHLGTVAGGDKHLWTEGSCKQGTRSSRNEEMKVRATSWGENEWLVRPINDLCLRGGQRQRPSTVVPPKPTPMPHASTTFWTARPSLSCTCPLAPGSGFPLSPCCPGQGYSCHVPFRPYQHWRLLDARPVPGSGGRVTYVP